MPTQPDILSYYGARANEYEEVYAKAERQDDLRQLHRVVPAHLAGRRVLEVACGTGYWTRMIATQASAITGCDLSAEVLALARVRQPATNPVNFVVGDAFAWNAVPGKFDAAFVGFWWSHILREDVARFLCGLHQRLPRASRVFLLDNRYVAGSNRPITRTDGNGNTYQRRLLDSGAEYEVLKNFPSPDELREAITSTSSTELEVHELQYYWYATYEVESAA